MCPQKIETFTPIQNATVTLGYVEHRTDSLLAVPQMEGIVGNRFI